MATSRRSKGSKGGMQGRWGIIGALIISYTIKGVPYYNYSIMGPKTLF